MVPMIEKSGSTMLDGYLKSQGWIGGHCTCGQATTTLSATKLMLNHPGCCSTSTFMQSVSQPSVLRLAFVRDPLDRFISGARPHKKWKLCSGATGQLAICPDDLKMLRKHAYMLLAKFEVRNLTPLASVHWYTQTYFLSATDRLGQPIPWDYIGRLETIEQDFANINALAHNHSGASRFKLKRIDVNASKQNVGVNPMSRKVLREAVLSSPDLACNFCRFYHQDYTCLGYPLPIECSSCDDRHEDGWGNGC